MKSGEKHRRNTAEGKREFRLYDGHDRSPGVAAWTKEHRNRRQRRKRRLALREWKESRG